MIAGALYSCVGILGYFGFADAHSAAQGAECAAAFPPPAPGALAAGKPPWLASANCTLSSDFLANFGSDLASPGTVYAFATRVSLLLQLFTVFPILLLIIRNQCFNLFLGTEWPGALPVAALNAGVMGVSFVFAALDLQIGAVLGYVGAVGGFVIVFAVPVAMEAVALLRAKRLVDGEGGGEGEEGEGGKGALSLASVFELAAWDQLRLGGITLVGLFFFIAQFLPL